MGLYDQIRFFRIPYAEIAAEVGVTETYVCAVLRGRRNNRSVTRAAQEALTRRKQALREALSKEPDHD